MKKKKNRLILVSMMFLLTVGFLSATTIENILKSPGSYIGKSETVEGRVEEWIEAPGGANYYLLKGDYGGIIKVNSTTKPQTGKRYQVTGLIQKDAIANKPLIAETGRNLISNGDDGGEEEEIRKESQRDRDRDIELERIRREEEQEQQTQLLLYILLGVVVLALIGIIIWKTQKKQEVTGPIIRDDTKPGGIKTIATPPRPDTGGFKTITYTPDPKTMKFIPARLEIISHEDKGKSFPLYGRSTEKGTIITIGRESKSGHKNDIEINAKFQTVSRQQAEIRAKDDKLFLKNLSEVNPTIINGKKLASGEMPELKIGDIIRMGELEFEYKSVK